MRSWELTLVFVPLLKAVLHAVEKTLLDSYGIECNFLKIEGALTSFLEKLKQAKNNMEVYANSSQVKELITTQTNIEMDPFGNHVPESKHVDLFLFDDHFLQLQQDRHREDKACLHETTLLWRRPDWGGTILEMMKYNEHVFLFDRRWYRVHVTPLTSWPDTAVFYFVLFCRRMTKNKPSNRYYS